MEIVFIRHGKTQGNVRRRYIGSTDEPLCPEGAAELCRLAARGAYPPVERAYVSPMKRCQETCTAVFPGAEQELVDDLREQAFGVFENRSYEELQFLPAYQKWLETAGGADIPQGEGSAAFRARCRAALGYCVEDALARSYERIAVVAHGGVLMAALSEYGRPPREFYGWQTRNGHGFLLEARRETWESGRILTVLSEIGGEDER